jgi:hypothetical protein
MNDNSTGIRAEQSVTGIQSEKPIPPWNRPGCIRRDYEAHRGTAQPRSRTKLLPDNVSLAALGAVLDRCEVNVASIGRARCVLCFARPRMRHR